MRDPGFASRPRWLLALLLIALAPSTWPSSGDPNADAQALADTIEFHLREAELALAANRLTAPPGDNALDHLLHVLVLAPDNALARAGMDEIARRYQQLAVRSAGNGDADEAAAWLDLAIQVAPGHELLPRTRDAMARGLVAPTVSLTLAGDALDREDTELAARLAELGSRAKREALFVVITSPVDTWSRWIYRQMNTAPPEQRLRARSELGPTARVELRALPN